MLHKSMRTPTSANINILLVEDYPPGMMVSTLMIEHLGYTVEQATCGKEAIEKVRAATAPFMAILMDINMHGIDGLETSKIIREIDRKKGIRNTIIAVTAHALSGDRQHYLDAGMNDYISKPINTDILARKLAALAQAKCIIA